MTPHDKVVYGSPIQQKQMGRNRSVGSVVSSSFMA